MPKWIPLLSPLKLSFFSSIHFSLICMYGHNLVFTNNYHVQNLRFKPLWHITIVFSTWSLSIIPFLWFFKLAGTSYLLTLPTLHCPSIISYLFTQHCLWLIIIIIPLSLSTLWILHYLWKKIHKKKKIKHWLDPIYHSFHTCTQAAERVWKKQTNKKPHKFAISSYCKYLTTNIKWIFSTSWLSLVILPNQFTLSIFKITLYLPLCLKMFNSLLYSHF